MEIEYTYHRIFTAALKNSKDQSLIPTDYKECVKNRICQHSLLVGQLKLYLKHFQGILFLYSREKKGSQKGLFVHIPLCLIPNCGAPLPLEIITNIQGQQAIEAFNKFTSRVMSLSLNEKARKRLNQLLKDIDPHFRSEEWESKDKKTILHKMDSKAFIRSSYFIYFDENAIPPRSQQNEEDLYMNVHPIQNINDLMEEFKYSLTMKSRLNEIKNKIKFMRKMRGDGNCYYRAVIYLYVEKLILKGPTQINDFIETYLI